MAEGTDKASEPYSAKQSLYFASRRTLFQCSAYLGGCFIGLLRFDRGLKHRSGAEHQDAVMFDPS
jgi:hypothetical protein